MAPIGHSAEREQGQQVLPRARARASLIPDLLIEAKRVSNTIFSGWHGRRKRGVGENFWQFRPYVVGESLARIDWRRSARDDNVYVKDKEWQATHVVWLYVDESPSMMFQSEPATVSKQSRAMVIAFAMAELLARSGERTGWLDVSRPLLSRNAAEKLAMALAAAPVQAEYPTNANVGNHSDIILFSDFLDPMDVLEERFMDLARNGARGHLVHIIDPVEEMFPYHGRVEFEDPETGQKITAGNAESLKQAYSDAFGERGERLQRLAAKLNWSCTRHHTDRLASEALASLHTHLANREVGR